MGQTFSRIWKRICPKKRDESLLPNNNIHQRITTTTVDDEDHHLLASHNIDIPPPESVGKHDEIINSSSVVIDLSSEFEQVITSKTKRNKKKKKKKKKGERYGNGGDQSSSLSSISHHHLQLQQQQQQVSSIIVKKIGQYANDQRLLLVGDGDFSFSACLAIAFGTCATNIVATSLNSQEFLMQNYGNFVANKVELQSRGSMVLHNVDATKMVKHPVIGSMVFDRIIFNFPHAGRFGHTDIELRAHQKLIRGFLRNAKKMIYEDGEIHITSKSYGFYLEWDIPKMGRDHNLKLIGEIRFRRYMYPGYNTKYGFGGDRDFDCDPSKTYKFGLSSK